MQKEISISTPREPHANLKHDRREYEDGQIPPHIDQTRTKYNINYIDRTLEDVYEEVFGRAIEEYDLKQKRKDRRIGSAKNYLEKITKSKQQHPMESVILQVGDMFSNGIIEDINEESFQLAKDILDQFVREVILTNKYPQLAIVGCYMHLDERVPHVHLDYVPVATYDKGMKVRVGSDRAFKQMGFEDKSKKGSYSVQLFIEDLRSRMAKIVEARGMEVEHVGLGKTQHQLIHEFKREAKIIEDKLDSLPTPEQINARASMLNKNNIVIPKSDYDALLERIKLTEEHNSIIERMLAEIQKLKDKAREYLNKVTTKIEELTSKIEEYTKAKERISPEHVNELEERIRKIKKRTIKAEKLISTQEQTIEEIKSQSNKKVEEATAIYEQQIIKLRKENKKLKKQAQDEWHNGWELGRASGEEDGYKRCMQEFNIKPKIKTKDFSL